MFLNIQAIINIYITCIGTSVYIFKGIKLMNVVTNSNYQTSFGMRKELKAFEIIQRKAKTVYPHISPYYMQESMCCESSVNNKFYKYICDLQKKLDYFRYNVLSDSRSLHKDIVDNLKNGLKLGNSYEEAKLASIIGKINGHKNVYTANIDGLDHAICVISPKPIKEGKSQILDKKSIVVDPQLGLTDYADNYFVRLKELKGKDNFRKLNCSVTPHKQQLKDEKVIKYLKEQYPELSIKDYKEPNDRVYGFVVGKKFIDGDTYVNYVNRAIFNKSVKSLNDAIAIIKTCNFAKVQYVQAVTNSERDIYKKVIKRCVDDLDQAIGKMEPKEKVDKLNSVLELFIRKYGHLDV